jgi:putative hydrolase of the HAD superfamily
MPGVNTLLQTLSEHAYYLGIISNGGHDTRLARAKTLTNYHHINKVVSSESAGIAKPNTAIFTNTLANAGLSPAQCWYVGDHPINDIQGARDAGLRTIWVKGFHPWPNDLKAADYAIEHLSEIIDLLSLDDAI